MTMQCWEPEEDPVEPPIKMKTLDRLTGIGLGFIVAYFLLHIFLP